MKYATIDKDTKLGDPAFVDTRRFAEVLSTSVARQRAAAICAADRAIVERMEDGGCQLSRRATTPRT